MEGNFHMGKLIMDENERSMILRWCSQIETMMREPGSPLRKLEK
jgi:hypothetical protein